MLLSGGNIVVHATLLFVYMPVDVSAWALQRTLNLFALMQSHLLPSNRAAKSHRHVCRLCHTKALSNERLFDWLALLNVWAEMSLFG